MDKKLLLAANDRKVVPHPVWGQETYLLVWTYNEMQRLRDDTVALEGKAFDQMCLAVVRSLCDAEGNLIFNDEDIPELRNKNPKILSDIVRAAYAANEIDIDSAKKNLETAKTDSSADSPPT